MRKLRRSNFSNPDVALAGDRNLCSGPIKLCQALNIKYNDYDGKQISTTNLELYDRKRDENIPVYHDTRIGVRNDWPRRFVWNGSKYLSKPARNSVELKKIG